MADFTTLESLYARGVLDINGKDFINGTNSNIAVNTQRDTFIPDSRFVRVDGPFMRDRVDRDTFMMSQQQIGGGSATGIYPEDQNLRNSGKKQTTKDMLKNIVYNKGILGVVSALALIFSGRYILKKLHLIK